MEKWKEFHFDFSINRWHFFFVPVDRWHPHRIGICAYPKKEWIIDDDTKRIHKSHIILLLSGQARPIRSKVQTFRCAMYAKFNCFLFIPRSFQRIKGQRQQNIFLNGITLKCTSRFVVLFIIHMKMALNVEHFRFWLKCPVLRYSTTYYTYYVSIMQDSRIYPRPPSTKRRIRRWIDFFIVSMFWLNVFLRSAFCMPVSIAGRLHSLQ